MVASALYGILSGALFDKENDLPQIAVIAIHFSRLCRNHHGSSVTEWLCV